MMKHILQEIRLRRKKTIIETPDFGEKDELDPGFKMLFQEAKKKNDDLDYNGAMLDLNRVINNAPENTALAEVYLYRGKLQHYEFKSYAAALADLENCIRLNALGPEAYRMRGDIKRELRDFKGAMKDLNKGIKLDKNHGDLYLSRGILYNTMQKRKKGIKDLEKASILIVSNSDEVFEAHLRLLIAIMTIE